MLLGNWHPVLGPRGSLETMLPSYKVVEQRGITNFFVSGSLALFLFLLFNEFIEKN